MISRDITDNYQNSLKWARMLHEQIEISKETFQERHDAVYESSKFLSDNAVAGPIQALNICMQIEMEFPGRIEEFVERSQKSRMGMLYGLMILIRLERLR